MSDVVLQLAGLLFAFILRLAVLYLACLGLTRLCHLPRHRFVVWLGFLGASVAYWVALYLTAFREWMAHRSIAAPLLPGTGSVAGGGRALLVPASWGHAIQIGGWLLPTAYLFGVLWLVGRVGWKHAALRRTLRRALLPAPVLVRTFQRMRDSLGLGECVLLVLPGLTSPATAFWWRPCVLLPEACNSDAPAVPVADALWHELAHVARRDYLWAVLADMAHCLLFFHPAVWHARVQLRIERELACDAAVVGGRPDRRADYAESLTRFARLRLTHGDELLGVDFVPSASLLQRRIRSVLAEPPRRAKWATGCRALAALLLMVALAPVWPLFAVIIRFAPTRPAATLSAAHPVSPAHVRKTRHVARKTVLPFHAATRWQQVKLAEATPPVINLGAPALPAFVPATNSNGPDSDVPAAEDGNVPRTSFATPRQAAWTEVAPYPRKRSSVIGSLAARVVAAVGIAGLDRDARTVHGRGH